MPQVNEQIKALQQQLKEAGLYDGPIDGIDGPATRAAARAFQTIQQQQQSAGQAAEIERLKQQAELQQAQAAQAEAERAANENSLSNIGGRVLSGATKALPYVAGAGLGAYGARRAMAKALARSQKGVEDVADAGQQARRMLDRINRRKGGRPTKMDRAEIEGALRSADEAIPRTGSRFIEPEVYPVLGIGAADYGLNTYVTPQAVEDEQLKATLQATGAAGAGAVAGAGLGSKLSGGTMATPAGADVRNLHAARAYTGAAPARSGLARIMSKGARALPVVGAAGLGAMAANALTPDTASAATGDTAALGGAGLAGGFAAASPIARQVVGRAALPVGVAMAGKDLYDYYQQAQRPLEEQSENFQTLNTAINAPPEEAGLADTQLLQDFGVSMQQIPQEERARLARILMERQGR